MRYTVALAALAQLSLAQKGKLKGAGGAAGGAEGEDPPAAGAAPAGAGGCSPLQLVYARATGEPKGGWSKGYGAAGYSLLTNVTALIPGADGYAVNYPASMGTQCQGAKDMMNHIKTQAAKCPQQKFALGGHSQGGFAVTISLKNMTPDLLSRVAAVTMFGSPKCPTNVSGKCISYCASGDPVCTGGGSTPASMESCSAGALGGAGGAAGGSPAKGLKGKGGFVVDAAAYPEDLSPSQETSVGSLEIDQWLADQVSRNIAAAPDCAKYSAMKTSGGSSGGHMGYSKSGEASYDSHHLLIPR